MPYGYILYKTVMRFSEILEGEQVGKRLKDFLELRTSVLRSWWSCQRKRCDYYQVYQAYGPADLTHIGYHAAERLALEHRASCYVRDERECDECKGWAGRLRGEVWAALMGNKSQIDESPLEAKEREFGFYQGDGYNKNEQ